MPNVQFQFPMAKTTFFESAIYSSGKEMETVLQNLSTKTEQFFFKWLKKKNEKMSANLIWYTLLMEIISFFSQEIYAS